MRELLALLASGVGYCIGAVVFALLAALGLTVLWDAFRPRRRPPRRVRPVVAYYADTYSPHPHPHRHPTLCVVAPDEASAWGAIGGEVDQPDHGARAA